MTIDTRKELYSFLRTQGILNPRQPLAAPSRRAKTPAVVYEISKSQADSLVEHLSWANWRVTTSVLLYRTAKTHILRPAIDVDAVLAGRAATTLPRWVTAIQSLPGKAIRGTNRLFHAHNRDGKIYSAGTRAGRISAGVLIYMALVDYIILFPLALTVVDDTFAPFLILAALLFGYLALSVIVANDLHYRRVILDLNETLEHTVVTSETIPQSWSRTLHDDEVHSLVVEWMRQRPDIDSLRRHIAVGEKLQGDLPADDSRHGSVHAEIESQRIKLHELMRNREKLAASIDQAAESTQTRERLAREAERRLIAEEQRAQHEQAKFQQKIHDVGVREDERLRTHDKIDRWFENGPA